jgi:hypothetical protein
MPTVIEIQDGGATSEQLDALTDQFLGLRVSRSRQPTLVFEGDNQPIETYQRTSNGSWLFDGTLVKDRQTLRDCLEGLLTKRGTITIGLTEGSAAREDF